MGHSPTSPPCRARSRSGLATPFDFLQPRDQGAAGDLLAETVRGADSDSPARHSALSAVVILQGGSDPGGGFYRLARHRHPKLTTTTGQQSDKFWLDKWNTCRELYGDEHGRYSLAGKVAIHTV